jgi:CRISPR-associated protein Csm4
MQPPLYRLRLKLIAPFGTPLVSDTLFGHLCWAIRDLRGEEALVRWLARQDEEPWLVSDAFPAGLLPRPILAPIVERDQKNTRKSKKDRRKAWIKVEDFISHREALSAAKLDMLVCFAPWEEVHEDKATPSPGARGMAARPITRLDAVRQAHNTIDRRSGRTPETGGLYFVDEDWTFAIFPYRDVYVRTHGGSEEITALFAAIGKRGYGKDATWGRGRFEVEGIAPASELEGEVSEQARLLSLSHGVLTDNMEEARYRLVTRYGKVGAELAACHERRPFPPFKYPILLSRPGTTFRPTDAGPFGALLRGVHQVDETVRHDARHLVIPFKEVTSS